MTLRSFLAKNKYLRSAVKLSKGEIPLYIEYAIDFKPRWKDGNPHLEKVLSSYQENYKANLSALSDLKPVVDYINDKSKCSLPIDWHNRMVPPIDAFTLMQAALNAKTTYMEVGSGNSTMLVKAALDYHKKDTKIISIDPCPREEIDKICDDVIRKPVEDIDFTIFDRLKAGDVLFIDNSHRSFMNSDVTVCMLEIIPRLRPGVLVGIHDIFLPYDYYESWSDRGYNEQYLLASYLIANPNYFDIQMANHWICRNGLQKEPLQNIWNVLGNESREKSGSAFWGIKN